MKKIAYILAIWLLAIAQAKAEGDTLVLSLADAVHLARQQSLAAQSREEFRMGIKSKAVPEVKERTFACDLLFTADKPSNIRLGKSYRVQIELGKPETAIVIPRGDFYQTTSGRWIYRLSPDGKTARKVDIEIGRQNPQQYEILSGLNPGDKVIVNRYDKLGDAEELVIIGENPIKAIL